MTARLRLDAIDLVRGIVMILMVLDHTRDFVHAGGMIGDPLDPATTTILLYVTRWVTHLCAPTFALLAGLGVGLRRLRGATAGEVSWFLFTRGLWLVVLELTLFRRHHLVQRRLRVPVVPAGDLGDRRVDDRAERDRPAAAAPRSRRLPA